VQLLSKRERKRKEEKTESALHDNKPILALCFGLVRAIPAFKATL